MQNRVHCCCFVSPSLTRLPVFPAEAQTHFDTLKFRLAVEIEAMRSKGVTAFLTGMARGPELWGAEIVLDLKRAYPDQEIQLIAMIPYIGQSDRWPEPYRDRYWAVLQAADDATALQSRYAPRCILQCSRYMIDNAAHMIAVYDGEQGDIRYAVEYANKKGLDVAVVRAKEFLHQISR
jgi:uncharacterized phage-like protein YoqJ